MFAPCANQQCDMEFGDSSGGSSREAGRTRRNQHERCFSTNACGGDASFVHERRGEGFGHERSQLDDHLPDAKSKEHLFNKRSEDS